MEGVKKMIELQEFGRGDFERLISWSGDEAFLLQWAGPGFVYPLNSEQLEAYVQDTNDLEQSDRLIFKAVVKESGVTVGHISLGGIDRKNRSGRVGKVLVDPDRRGEGIGGQMIAAVLSIGFDQLNLHRISLGVFDFNESAAACYRKAGFTQEGILRDARRYKDSFWNLIEMSILENEWDRKKKVARR